MKDELFDYKGTLVQDTGKDNLATTVLGPSYSKDTKRLQQRYKRVKYLATDSETWEHFRVIENRCGYILETRLTPVTEKELPLYLGKKYKSEEFMEIFR